MLCFMSDVIRYFFVAGVNLDGLATTVTRVSCFRDANTEPALPPSSATVTKTGAETTATLVRQPPL